MTKRQLFNIALHLNYAEKTRLGIANQMCSYMYLHIWIPLILLFFPPLLLLLRIFIQQCESNLILCSDVSCFIMLFSLYMYIHVHSRRLLLCLRISLARPYMQWHIMWCMLYLSVFKMMYFVRGLWIHFCSVLKWFYGIWLN